MREKKSPNDKWQQFIWFWFGILRPKSTLLRSFHDDYLTYSHFPWQSLSLRRLTRICTHTFASNWQLPFLNQRMGENDRNNYFLINLHERYLAELGFKLAISWFAVRRATDCAMEPDRNAIEDAQISLYGCAVWSGSSFHDQGMPRLACTVRVVDVLFIFSTVPDSVNGWQLSFVLPSDSIDSSDQGAG